MKRVLLMLLPLWISTNAMADKVVTKSTFVNQGSYANKSMDEIQKILFEKVKIDAASEIFGDFIKNETTIDNGRLIKDFIISDKNGIVHIQDGPHYTNGKNFGDIEVTITAYATDEDLYNMSIQKISLANYTYANANIPLKDLKLAAEDAFLIEALSQQKPSLKTHPNKKGIARDLAVSINIKKMAFDVNSCSYTMNGEVEYIPFFLKHQ